ncbi:CvpA family protein [Mariprofundus sp. NF]|uniref:CvpA family protein n=1 Tax=Mariprofundus sp. NF TaxID=2608716 RepID=UPI0015A4890E|nr:CvpA family protein [Mariprofundus sp. NF]NWF39665.1 CvpA family protein [Mariprofundus sp. NF]
MNFVDYILIAIVGLSMVLSLWRGFVREVISLIGLVLAFLAASRLSGQAGDYLGQWIDNATIADGAGFAIVFVIVMLVVGLIGAVIRKLVDIADLTATDRTLGIFFGAARGMLLIALAFLVYTTISKPSSPWLKNSMLTPYAIELGDMLGGVIPEGYPFSRQGSAKQPSPQQTKASSKDLISIKDKQALKAILENSTK